MGACHRGIDAYEICCNNRDKKRNNSDAIEGAISFVEQQTTEKMKRTFMVIHFQPHV